MDGSRFDHLARQWATRRAAIGGLLIGATGLASLDAEAKRKRKRKHPDDHTVARKKRQNAGVATEKKKKKKCKGGTLKCGKKLCVNASTDANNCGACGNRCGAGQACVNGVCTSTGAAMCPSGQIRCEDRCVDPQSDEAHCGGCGQACSGDLTCLGGTCACADPGDTVCGALCVDTQTDRQNCGGCGKACAAGATCSGGQCRVGSGYPCNDVYDCGGAYRGVECRDNQCACENPAEGLCRDPELGSYAICDVCCPGGNRTCPGDKVCNAPASPTARCDCPVGTTQCAGSTNSSLCQAGLGQDNRRCGTACVDCIAQNGNTSFCCFGDCYKACEPNTSCTLKTCGGCQTCGEGTACCRSGSTDLYGCELLVNGKCPGAA